MILIGMTINRFSCEPNSSYRKKGGQPPLFLCPSDDGNGVERTTSIRQTLWRQIGWRYDFGEADQVKCYDDNVENQALSCTNRKIAIWCGVRWKRGTQH